jgi:hypothetical protein
MWAAGYQPLVLFWKSFRTGSDVPIRAKTSCPVGERQHEPIQLDNRIAAMIFKELVVNGFATRETFVHPVPEADAFFAEFPA